MGKKSFEEGQMYTMSAEVIIILMMLAFIVGLMIGVSLTRPQIVR
jgi:uncharacterized protein YneF (UPF0154 family)